jgi:hypothetical protein
MQCDAMQIALHLASSVVALSLQKFSSNVIEKCLQQVSA